jgi:serine/threonine-protein kinase
VAAEAARKEWDRLQREREARAPREASPAAEEIEAALEKNAGAGMDVSLRSHEPMGGERMATHVTAPQAKIESAKVENAEVVKAPAMSSDRYQVRREIQLGGQGTCKVAFDQLAEREVIVKISQAQGGWGADRIMKEARFAAKLNHPNVTRLLELGNIGKDQVFMTMPYIEGSSLDQVIKKISDAGIPGLTGYSITAVAELFDKVCAGVEHAHSAGVLHLDLKPQNIIVGSRGEVVVIDFGISQAINADIPKRYASNEAPAAATLSTTLTGSLPGDAAVRAVGTPSYLSPEQWAGDPGTFTERTDVYGLGGVLFFLLTGNAPNQVQRPTDLDPYFRHSPIPQPSEYTRRRIPPELDALCVKCLARDPAQRYASVFHVRHVLKCWLSRPEMWELYRANY